VTQHSSKLAVRLWRWGIQRLWEWHVYKSHTGLLPLMVSSKTFLHILAVTAVLDSMVELQLISIWMAL